MDDLELLNEERQYGNWIWELDDYMYNCPLFIAINRAFDKVYEIVEEIWYNKFYYSRDWDHTFRLYSLENYYDDDNYADLFDRYSDTAYLGFINYFDSMDYNYYKNLVPKSVYINNIKKVIKAINDIKDEDFKLVCKPVPGYKVEDKSYIWIEFKDIDDIRDERWFPSD